MDLIVRFLKVEKSKSITGRKKNLNFGLNLTFLSLSAGFQNSTLTTFDRIFFFFFFCRSPHIYDDTARNAASRKIHGDNKLHV